MAGLTAAELVGHPTRINVFLRKYKEHDWFELDRGGKVRLKVQRTNIAILESKNQAEIAKLRFIEDKSRGTPRSFPTGAFKITSEFRKPTDRYENDVVNDINTFIDSRGGIIDVTIGGMRFPEITTTMKVEKSELRGKWGIKGEVKADIILCSDPTHPLFNAIFISHKKYGGPAEFQQFGGVSERSGLIQRLNKDDKEELNGFLRALPTYIVDNRLVGVYMRPIKSQHMMKLAVFGSEYSPGYFSLDSVHLVGQGLPSFQQRGNSYELQFPEFSAVAGDITPFSGLYKLVIGAQYRSETKKNAAGEAVEYARGFEVDGTRYLGARVGFYTEGFMRKNAAKII
jgi:hypothetical protein